jgi:O-antigen/teichoic acid export membrane protein
MKSDSTQLANLASNAGVGLVGRFGGRFLIVVNGILAARFLGPEVFGLYSIGLAIFRILETEMPW